MTLIIVEPWRICRAFVTDKLIAFSAKERWRARQVWRQLRGGDRSVFFFAAVLANEFKSGRHDDLLRIGVTLQPAVGGKKNAT